MMSKPDTEGHSGATSNQADVPADSKRKSLMGEQTIPGRYSTEPGRHQSSQPDHWAIFKLFRRGSVNTYTMDPDQPVTFVGTNPDECDLVFKDSTLSDKQLAITRIGDDYVLTDCGRKDIVTFNGIASRQAVCPSGEKCVINMGNSTMVFDTLKHHHPGIRQTALRYALSGPPIANRTDRGRVTFVIGPRTIALGLDPVVIGTCAICDLVLSDKMLQPFHAMFHWTPDGVCITRLSNGAIRVNGVAIKKSKILTLTDRIQLGGATFTMKTEGLMENMLDDTFGGNKPQFERFCFSPLKDSACPRFSVPVTCGDIMIGRTPDVDVFLDDEWISREHVQLIPSGKTCMVLDNYSTNGTFINGEPVSKGRMRVGDILEIGRNRFLFHYE